MTGEEKVARVARHWMDRAREALASARDEAAAGRASFAINRCLEVLEALLPASPEAGR